MQTRNGQGDGIENLHLRDRLHAIYAAPAAAVPSRNSCREEGARYAVEVVKVAKTSLYDGEQVLAIAWQEALRLGSIEAGKLHR